MNETQRMEALGILQEECAEVIQAVSKIRRTGLDYRPNDGPKTNYELLLDEVQDVLTILTLLEINRLGVEHFHAKLDKLRVWSTLLGTDKTHPAVLTGS